jgi:Flp pilus assembly protein TadG
MKRVRRFKQNGAAAVEFALVAVVFFMFVFGILELARVMYMFNTLAEVTRSAAGAAANIDFQDAGALNDARRRAVFSGISGQLLFGDPVTYENLNIDYLSFNQASGTLQHISPASLSCPARVRLNCLTNRSGSNCVRAVRVRVCRSGGNSNTCEPLEYKTIFPLVNLGMPLPVSTTIVTPETLGYRAGDPLCPG